MSATTHSPSEILHTALVAAARMVDPVLSPTGQWRGYIDHLPDEDDVISIRGSAGQKDGRVMTGETIVHPGYQVRVRAADYAAGQVRITYIADWFDTVQNLAVGISPENYTILAITRTGGIIPLGHEPESRRVGFTLNGTLAIRQA